jgi:hypothetical protein
MLVQCVSAACTLAVIILAILILTRAISLKDALKAAGKALLVFVLLYFSTCMLLPPVTAGAHALTLLLQAAIRWLVVTVLVAALLIVIVQALRWRFSTRSRAQEGQTGGE